MLEDKENSEKRNLQNLFERLKFCLHSCSFHSFIVPLKFSSFNPQIFQESHQLWTLFNSTPLVPFIWGLCNLLCLFVLWLSCVIYSLSVFCVCETSVVCKFKFFFFFFRSRNLIEILFGDWFCCIFFVRLCTIKGKCFFCGFAVFIFSEIEWRQWTGEDDEKLNRFRQCRRSHARNELGRKVCCLWSLVVVTNSEKF